MAAIEHRTRADRRFLAELHDKSLLGDELVVGVGRVHNRSHGAMQRMEARRRQRGER